MGSIRQRGRLWYVRYMDHRGVQVEESSKSTRKSDAIRLLQLREGKKAEGGPVLPSMGRITFDEAAADLVADYTNKDRKSLPAARRRIRLHLRPFFGGRTKLAAITAAHVIEYAVERRAPVTLDEGTEKPGAAPASVNRELSLIRRMFNLAIKNKKLLHDQKPSIELLPENNVRRGFVDHDQFEVAHRLAQHARNRVGQQRRAVVRRDED